VIDLAVGSPTAISHGLGREVLHVDSWVLVVPDRSPLATIAQLESLSVFRDVDLIEHCCHPLPLDPDELGVRAVVSCDRTDVVLELVAAGAGYAVVPELAVGRQTEGMRVIALDAFIPPRVISLLWSSARLVLPADVLSGPEPAPAAPAPDISAAA
jgi:DNA-binding transcriptional LysR family regulator